MPVDWKQRASEGITVFRASRLEALLEPLDHLLATQPPASPLQPQTVVAAHPGMRQWLAGALARRRGPGGIVANLDIVLPSTFLDTLAREVLGEGAVSPRGWRREALRWHLHALLERPAMQNAARADQLVLDSDDVQHILGRAVASASLCVMQTGCVPPSRDQVVERVATLRPMFRSL